MASEPLKSIIATQWANLNNNDLISAPSISLLRTSGDFGAALALTSAGAALDAVRIGGAITSGNWNINGSTGTVVADSTAIAWNADFAGAVRTLQINTDASGAITAQSIRTLRIGNDASSASITLTGAGTLKTPDIAQFSVGGTFSDSTLRSAGDIDSIRLGAIDGSNIFAGVAATTIGLVTAASQFIVPAEIVSFTITGVRGAAFAVTNSTIDAAQLGSVVVQRVDNSNGGVPFGFSTVSLASFTDLEPRKPEYHWIPSKGASALDFAGDFAVKLV
jgi:hypothetical protein